MFQANLFLYDVGYISAVIAAWILWGIVFHKVRIVSSEIFVHSSAKIFYSTCSDECGAYQLLTSLSKMRCKCLIILKYEDSGGKMRCLTSLECTSWHAVTNLAEWSSALSS